MTARLPGGVAAVAHALDLQIVDRQAREAALTGTREESTCLTKSAESEARK